MNLQLGKNSLRNTSRRDARIVYKELDSNQVFRYHYALSVLADRSVQVAWNN